MLLLEATLSSPFIDLLHIPIEMKSLLLDKSYIDYTGKTCGKIGLTASTLIKRQDKCTEHDHCVANQIPELMETMSLSSALPNTTLVGDRDNRILVRDGIASSAIQLYVKTSGEMQAT